MDINKKEKMDFYSIVASFTSHKVSQYAEKEIVQNREIMNETLAQECYNDLYYFLYPQIGRIFAYEYNKMQDEGTIDSTLSAEELYYAFGGITLTKEYSQRFDEKFFIFLRIVGKQLQDLALYQREIFENYQKDQQAINSLFFDEYDEIQAIECSKGDLHNGKSVAFITFKNGKKLVYKPRNEDNSLLLEKVVVFLAQGTKIKDYHFIQYYAQEDHSWEIIAEHRLCNTVEEIEKYYYRAGVLLSAFYFLNSYDMHNENIISCGEYPVVVDCETITCAPQRSASNAQKGLNASVLHTGFIPYFTKDDVYGLNISGVLSEKGTDVYSENEQYQLVVNNGKVEYQRSQYQAAENQSAVSLLNGETLERELVKQHLIMGFKDACLFALSHKDEFSVLVKDFAFERRIISRQILRSTQVYFEFLTAGLHPEMLQDNDKRHDLFMILSRNFVPGNFGYLRVQREISDLEKGNIPLFYTNLDSTDLFSGKEVVCKDYFLESPVDCVLGKINEFNEELLDYQIDLIKKSFALLAEKDLFGRTYIRTPPSRKKMTPSYLEHTSRIWAEKLKRMSIELAQEIRSMIILELSSGKRLFFPEATKVSLYQSGGIPLFLVYYGMYYNDKAAVKYGKQLVKTSILDTAQFATDKQNKKTNNSMDPKTNLSVFDGIGGALYLSYNIGIRTSDKEFLNDFLDEAKIILDIFLKKEKMELDDFEYLSGSISSIFFICKVFLSDPEFSATLKDDLFRAIDKCVAEFDIEGFSIIGFGHGISGLLIVFNEFFKLTQRAEVLELIEQLLEKEDKLIAEEKWDQKTDFSWCHGKSGVLLSRSILKSTKIPLNRVSSILSKYDDWIDSTEYFDLPNLCLCHGVFGNIEIAKAVKGSSFNVDKHAPDCLFDSFSDLSWIKGTDYEYEGFMLGNTGIAYVMLEMLNAAPRVLSLEIWDQLL